MKAVVCPACGSRELQVESLVGYEAGECPCGYSFSHITNLFRLATRQAHAYQHECESLADVSQIPSEALNHLRWKFEWETWQYRGLNLFKVGERLTLGSEEVVVANVLVDDRGEPFYFLRYVLDPAWEVFIDQERLVKRLLRSILREKGLVEFEYLFGGAEYLETFVQFNLVGGELMITFEGSAYDAPLDEFRERFSHIIDVDALADYIWKEWPDISRRGAGLHVRALRPPVFIGPEVRVFRTDEEVQSLPCPVCRQKNRLRADGAVVEACPHLGKVRVSATAGHQLAGRLEVWFVKDFREEALAVLDRRRECFYTSHTRRV